MRWRLLLCRQPNRAIAIKNLNKLRTDWPATTLAALSRLERLPVDLHSEGLSRFDGYKFTNYGIDQGLLAASVDRFSVESRTEITG